MAYLPLSTANLPDPAIDPAQGSSPADYFTSHIYSGDDSNGRAISIGFNPDLVWTKRRDGVANHHLMDAVRGTLKTLHSDTTDAEDTGFEGVSSFTSPSDGYSLNTDTSETSLNDNGKTYVSWNWKANGSGVSNTDGSITSTVSANTESGFSIVSYTGNSTAGATVGHGLDQAPDLIINKNRGTTNYWNVYTSEYGGNYTLYLNTTNSIAGPDSVWWNGADAGASVFTLGNNITNNATSNNYISYCFHSVEGFSKFGSYVGTNNSDGPFVYTGFRPAFVVCKNTTTSGGDWAIIDTVRDTYNVATKQIWGNSSSAEATGSNTIDIVSNGFKVRASGLTNFNKSGETVIYMAFAENPFKYSNAR